jgi:hypothetical protein
MAAITVAAKGAGATLAAASGGGDTVAAVPGKAGGWQADGSVVLIVTVGATPTVVTVDGTAQASLTSKTIAIPLNPGVYPRTIAVTYDQVTAVTVGAVVL